MWTATRGGLKLYGDARVLTGSSFTDAASYSIRVWPVEPAAPRPLTVAGTVAGLLAGWLLVAAAARRRLTTSLVTAGVAAATLPAHRFYRETYAVPAYPHGSPDPRTVESPHGGTLALIWTVAGLLTIVTAAIVARRPGQVRGWGPQPLTYLNYFRYA